MNIVEIATGSADLQILVRALSVANLVTTIRDSTDITVFAPTDAAFGQLAADLGFTGDVTDENEVFDFIVAALTDLSDSGDPIPPLTQILTYHVAGNVLDAAAVTAADTIPTLQAGAIFPAVPVLVDLEPDVLNPALIDTDIAADNGIVHLIDRVLLPFDLPGNDVPSITGLVAASGDGADDNPDDFDLLLTAVLTGGLEGVLDTEGLDATVFAPTDAAFVSLAQDLGFQGSDELGALGAIVATLTDLGGGDPIPLLTEILTYHVSPGTKQSQQVLAASEFETLQGGSLVRNGLVLADEEPSLTDPNLVASSLDILASNGIVHAIDAVLIPFALPASNGSGQPLIKIGTEGRDRLEGGVDSDLLVQKGAGDLLIGGASADVFQLANTGTRSKIIDFEDGIDTIDISAWGVTDLGELAINQRGESSLLVGSGSNGVVIQSAAGVITVADLAADSFIFAGPEQGEIIIGTDGRDQLEGTAGADLIVGGLGRDFLIGSGGNDVFVAGGDAFDVILDFTENADQIDLSEWLDTSFGSLTFTQFKLGLVEISNGSESIRVQAADREITGADFDQDDFIFS
ncbi:MAG: fasciclin domain-containing protein [Paracoccaceae bacterium]